MRRSRHIRLLACTFTLATATTSMIVPASAGAESRGTGFDASRSKVRYAGSVTVRGGFEERFSRPTTSAQAGAISRSSYGTRPASDRPVRIERRIKGAKSWKTVGFTRTGDAGRYRKSLRMRRTGYLRARLADGTATAKQLVRVGSLVRSRVKNRHLVGGGSALVLGHVNPGNNGRKVVVKVGSQKERTRTGRGGRFSVRVPVNGLGTQKVTVRAKGDRAASGDRARAGKVTAYRRAFASYYGPGLYGNRTACGQTLSPSTMGVAHKTLPCGTKLTIRNGNHTVRVSVIDRGPYAAGREFDLTEATKNKLGFGSTGYILVNK